MLIETKELDNGLTVEIWHDDSGAESPREWSNLGTFFGFNGRYQSPDAAPDADPQKARRIAKSAGNICLPVWLYDHSGTAYHAAESNPFHCPWDSGLFGYIYVTRADVRKEYGVKRVSSQIIERVKHVLQAEVAAYSAWANGEVYGWKLLDADGEEIDACWGYVGDRAGAERDAEDSAKHQAAA